MVSDTESNLTHANALCLITVTDWKCCAIIYYKGLSELPEYDNDD